MPFAPRAGQCLQQILALCLPTCNATSGADYDFNKTEIDLMCAGMAGREAEMQRRALALAVTAAMLCCASATRAQALYPAEFAVCQPLPPWYPRGWELMVRYPCVTYAYGPAYYPPVSYPYPTAYPRRRVSVHAVQRVHRRPYLRPGWWW